MFKSGKPKTESRLSDATYIVIDWTDAGGSALTVVTKAGSIDTRNGFNWSWPQNISPSTDADEAGSWLRQQLDNNGVKTTNAIVSMPSRNACLRVLNLPDVPGDEQLQLIALQAESLQSGGDEELCYDFRQIPASDSNAESAFVLSSVEPEVYESTARMCQAAGLKLKACGIGSFELNALSPVGTKGTSLSVLREDTATFLMLSSNGIPMRAISIAAVDEATIATRIASSAARLLASMPGDGGSQLSHVCLFGDVSIGLQERMIDAFPNSAVHAVSVPQGSVQSHALVASLSKAEHGFDYVRPRHRVDTKPRWAKFGRLAVGGTILCGLLMLWNYDQHWQYEQQIAQLTESADRQQELNERGQPLLRRWQYVSEWQSSSVDWTAEIRELAEHFPTTGEGYLTRLQLEQTTESDAPLVRVDGLVTNSDVAMKLNRAMMESDKYSLRPQGIEPAPHDSDFHSSYRIEASVTDR